MEYNDNPIEWLLESSVWKEPSATKVVWVAMLTIVEDDGVVNGTVDSLAAISRVTVSECREALRVFMLPDPRRAIDNYDGRRIEEIRGGWRIWNFS